MEGFANRQTSIHVQSLFRVAARQPAYLNIVKQEEGYGLTTECLAAVSVAMTNEECNRKLGRLSTVATVPFTRLKRAAAFSTCVHFLRKHVAAVTA